MREMEIGTMIFSAVAGAAVASAALWMLKEAGAARRRTINPPAGFLAAALIFGAVYAADRAAFPVLPGLTWSLNLAVVAGLLLYHWIRRKAAAVRPANIANPHLLAEIASLERMLQRDPLNAFCHEKLSELHEKLGRRDLALRAARAAADLDPTVKNRLRVEELEKGSKGGRA